MTMSNQELETTVRGLILKVYGAVYNDKLHVENKDGIYSLWIPILSWMDPTVLSIETDDENVFLKFIEDELKKRNYVKDRRYVWKKDYEGLHNSEM